MSIWMADYIFNVYLHTDRTEFNVNYPLSDYTSDLPGFYFTRNEFVSPKAQVEIPYSILSCRGANVSNMIGAMEGHSEQETIVTLSTSNTLSAINATMGSKALVPASSIKYADITDIIYVICCGIYHFD